MKSAVSIYYIFTLSVNPYNMKYISKYLSIYYLFIYLSLYPSTYISLYLSIYLSRYLSVYLSIYLSIYLKLVLISELILRVLINHWKLHYNHFFLTAKGYFKNKTQTLSLKTPNHLSNIYKGNLIFKLRGGGYGILIVKTNFEGFFLHPKIYDGVHFRNLKSGTACFSACKKFKCYEEKFKTV